MIKRLHVRNYAIIEELDLHFADGLTIITGETGAGKSILLGALGLIMGNRADNKALFNEQEKCVVEGFFDIRSYELQEFFQENDIDYEDELVLRREFTPAGKSRAFINDTPVNLKLMQELCSQLVDLHQQFDTLDIHNTSFQLKMLDALAGNKGHLAAYRQLFRAYQSNKRQLDQLDQLRSRSNKESEFLAFQLEELQAAALQAGEQEGLEGDLTALSHAEEIKKTAGGLYAQLIESEQAVVGQLQHTGHLLGQVSRFDSRMARLQERLGGVIAELQDLGADLEKVAEDTEYDPERIQQIQARLDLIYRLQKKHGVVSIGELLEIRQQIEAQLGGFADQSAEIQALRTQIEQQEGALIRMAQELSERRKSVKDDFSRQVVDLLGLLAMEYAQFEVQFHLLSGLGPNGWDEVSFLFAANKGSRLQAIRDVASGGELSRLALVTKSLVASSIPLPTLIFDEIDSGISGDVALKMGNILRKLSNEHQVVTITHSPQIASKADRHFFVYKQIRDDRTLTKVKALDEEDRVLAIATMLSQSPPSDSAMENARELLQLKAG
ncbi:MAG: DNA repair protein RecN [Haliscomenobacter sp.]|nr:DNA repair protein RecN [Haliscomenobacter sp.]